MNVPSGHITTTVGFCCVACSRVGCISPAADGPLLRLLHRSQTGLKGHAALPIHLPAGTGAAEEAVAEALARREEVQQRAARREEVCQWLAEEGLENASTSILQLAYDAAAVEEFINSGEKPGGTEEGS